MVRVAKIFPLIIAPLGVLIGVLKGDVLDVISWTVVGLLWVGVLLQHAHYQRIVANKDYAIDSLTLRSRKLAGFED